MKRLFLILVGVLVSLAAFAAPTTIRFWFIGDVNSQTDPYSVGFRQILDGFEAANPTIKVSVDSVVWDQIDNKVKIAVKAGNPPDVTFYKGQTLAGHVNAGSLMPLDDYISKMPKQWQNDFAPAQNAMCTSVLDGKRYGFLTSIH